MPKPRVFIGSSTEGLLIAQAVFSRLERDSTPTVWTHQLFLPGEYPLDVLDREIRRHDFACLVASPDDEIIKHGLTLPAMRDNLLLEFGLFSGALGRRRTFFLCPDNPRIDLPSDLLGLLTATYDGERVTLSAADRSAAVQTACGQIRDRISQEWQQMQQAEAERAMRIRATKETQSVTRLYTVATRLQSALVELQQDALAVLSNQSAFEQAKQKAITEIQEIVTSFAGDAQIVGTEQELEELRVTTCNALLDLPFPEEISAAMETAEGAAAGVAFDALNTFLHGGDPVKELKTVVSRDTTGLLSKLSERYSSWWRRHSRGLQMSTLRLQDALTNVLIKIASERNASA